MATVNKGLERTALLCALPFLWVLVLLARSAWVSIDLYFNPIDATGFDPEVVKSHLSPPDWFRWPMALARVAAVVAPAAIGWAVIITVRGRDAPRHERVLSWVLVAAATVMSILFLSAVPFDSSFFDWLLES